MKSYVSIDCIEGKYAVGEVELCPIEESNPEDYALKQTVMIDIPLTDIITVVEKVEEGDILIIEHDGENVLCVYCKDEGEKARRVELIKKIMS